MPAITSGENNQEILTIALKSSQQIVIDLKTIIKKYQEKFNTNTPEKNLADIFHNYIKALQDSPYPKNLGAEAFSFLFNKEKSAALKKQKMIDIIDNIIPEIVSKIGSLEYTAERAEMLTTIKNYLCALKISEDARHERVIGILKKDPKTKFNPDVQTHKEFQNHGKNFPSVADDVATKIITACEEKLTRFFQKNLTSATINTSSLFETTRKNNEEKQISNSSNNAACHT